MASNPGVEPLLDFVLSPMVWLSVSLALLYSALFYGWKGGGLRQLARDLLAGLVGFAIGQAIGSWRNWDLLMIGQVQLLAGTVGAILALTVGRSISQRSAKNK